jgi:hypothetical protein
LEASTDMAQKHYCLGKEHAVFDSRTLRFGAYLTAALPVAPDSVNWGKNVKSWPMYLNDKYGDCTCAAAGHMIQNWGAAVGKKKKPSDKQILKFYEHFATPGPKTRCHMLKVLKYWRSTGLAGDKITAFAQLEPRNDTEVKDAVWIFGGCYIGVKLPKFAHAAAQQGRDVPWVVPPQGPVGDAAPDANGHHCIPAVAYDSRNLYIVTWGMVKSMSWQFYTAYADEAYAILSADFLSKHKTPAGFDMAQLTNDLAEIGKVPATRAMISYRR